MKSPNGWLVAAVVVVLWVGSAAGSATDSARTTELVRRDCRTSISRQEITLFANGTLRLRLEGRQGVDVKLAELNPEEVEAYTRRLADEDLSEVAEGRAEIQGDFVEQCSIELALPERTQRRFVFGRFDSLPLALSRANRVLDDMLLEVEHRSPVAGLPREYVPRAGDILERADGARFEVVSWTSDRRGVELSGLDDPLTIIIAIESIHQEFVSVVQRRRWP